MPYPITIKVDPDSAGKRVDQFLASRLPDTSRARVQQLIGEGKVLVNSSRARPSLKLRGGEEVSILGDPALQLLRAIPEDISLDVIYEDAELAVINNPAGMMVHAGAGDDQRNRGTLVNALLHHFGELSGVGGEMRPGIVHRLDKETSGLIVVAKNDAAHRKLAAQFSGRKVKKQYIALVHGWPVKDHSTINAEISRDAVRRTRMTTRGRGGRAAVTHYDVRERFDSPYGRFALLDVRIETGRTHQIRVHMSSLGYPIVGDTLYGAPKALHRGGTQARRKKAYGRASSAVSEEETSAETLSLGRNFLHAASIEFAHPRTGQPLALQAPLPADLQHFLARLTS